MSRNIIVTGAAGALGSAVVEKFKREGYYVIALLRPDAGEVAEEADDSYEVDVTDAAAVADFVKECQKNDIKPIVVVEFINDDELLFVCLSKNHDGFAEINRFLSKHKLQHLPFPETAPKFRDVFTIYPFKKKHLAKPNDWIGVSIGEVNKLWQHPDLLKQIRFQ